MQVMREKLNVTVRFMGQAFTEVLKRQDQVRDSSVDLVSKLNLQRWQVGSRIGDKATSDLVNCGID